MKVTRRQLRQLIQEAMMNETDTTTQSVQAARAKMKTAGRELWNALTKLQDPELSYDDKMTEVEAMAVGDLPPRDEK